MRSIDKEKLPVPREYALWARCKRRGTLPRSGGELDQPHILMVLFDLIDREHATWAKIQKEQQAQVRFYHAIVYDDDGVPSICGTNSDPAESGLGAPNLAEGMYLKQNEPNPFRDSTAIIFGIPTTTHVKITIYDHNSRLVRTLVNDVTAAGEHRIMWDGRDDEGKRFFSWRQICKIEIGEYYHAIDMAPIR